jgi:uncharacterized protein (UPF0276 family)
MIGVGLRHIHFPYLEAKPKTSVDWFEGITENFFDTEGRPIKILEMIRRDYPVGLHGVSLSIGSAEELDFDYLKKTKALYDRIKPQVISDHLCWTGHKNRNLHNLLPLAYNQKSLKYLVPRLQTVQEFYGRELCIENLSAYLDLNDSDMTEWDFLRELALQSGCKILLDINNIYVNSQNHQFDPYQYLNAIPDQKVGEIHLAGFTDMGDFLFDTHSKPVYPEVWKLFEHKIKKIKDVPVLIEWDEDIPEFPILELEAQKAREIQGRA